MSYQDEQIDLACKGFRNAVQAFCRRRTTHKEGLPKDVELLVNHSTYLLKQLTKKRSSLQNGLNNLRKNLWPRVLDQFQKADPNDQAALLQHFLEQCLRLHDGKMLLVSGECRHQGDIRMAKKQTKFSSRLNLQGERDDGYTKMFNAPGGYSGYGWDEYYDDRCGIKERLLLALQKHSAKGKKRRTKDINKSHQHDEIG